METSESFEARFAPWSHSASFTTLPTCRFLANVRSKCFAPVCPFQIGYDMSFTPAICEANFLFTGDPGLIAKIPRVVTRQARTPSRNLQCGPPATHRLLQR
jgi:hypothetical protein